MVINGNYNGDKLAKKFACNSCLYICSKESDYNKHLLTRKHKNGNKMVTNGKYGEKVADALNTVIIVEKNTSYDHMSVSDVGDKFAENTHITVPYMCQVCGQCYKHASGLSRHRKTCSNHVVEKQQQIITIPPPSSEVDFKEIVLMLLKENKEFQKTVIELIPHIKGNAEHSYNNTNSHNTQNFNIQMFLNEHCKNAMNLTDFIDSLPITAETYDNTIQNGLTKTLTNMITNGLSQLDILERPIHCTDATRKTLYVKEANNWEKDTELLRILLGIRNLARKQRTMISEWKDVNVGWEKDDNIQTKLTTLICHSMTDIENDEKETSKIIRAISKNVYLDNEAKQLYIK